MIEPHPYPLAPAGAFPNSAFPLLVYRGAPSDPAAVEAAFKLLTEAEAPVLLCGNGVIASGATAAAVELAERFSMPVVTTFNGKSAIPFDHPLAMGPAGAFGSEIARETPRVWW